MKHAQTRRFCVLLLVPALYAASAGLDITAGGRMTLKGFDSQGRRDDGTVTWELHGEEASIRGVFAELTTIRLTFHLPDGETAVIRSPKCLFNQTNRTGESDSPIHAESRRMRLEGVGYDLLVDAQRLHLRSDVHMTLLGIRKGRGGDVSPVPGLLRDDRVEGDPAEPHEPAPEDAERTSATAPPQEGPNDPVRAP